MRAVAVLSLLTISNLGYSDSTVAVGPEIRVSIDYLAKDYSYLLGMHGFNDSLLKMHFELYQGHVKNINFLLSKLKDWALQDKATSYEYIPVPVERRPQAK